MPVPKFRTSASKRDMRRSHHALSMPSLSVCPNCGEIKVPHVVCGACGHYRGKQVMDIRTADTNWDAEDFNTEETKG